jgi:hypothetical protein
MRLDIGNDRQAPKREQDPVISKAGVFALVTDKDLSETEKARAEHFDEREARQSMRPHRLWLPQDVMRKLTSLYKRFKKPRR